MWLRVSHSACPLPEQGWKLHVSASVHSAEVTLGRILPVLIAEAITFKVARSLDALAVLNSGRGQLSQVGKFATVYPTSDEQAVRVAVALDAATAGLPGPPITSDSPLRPGSRVSYRYGSFGSLAIRRRTGEVLSALCTPDGQLVADVRATRYHRPDWAVDPFMATGVSVTPPAQPRVVGDRYILVAVLNQTVRGKVYLAVDLDEPRTCVLKQAPISTQMGVAGEEPRDRLRREHAVLKRLSGVTWAAQVFGMVEDEQHLYLVMEALDGETLEQRVGALARVGRTLSVDEVVTFGRALAGMLAQLHAAGIVFRDLKSPNVVVGADDRLHIVDFESACELGSLPATAAGTRGYVSAEQLKLAPADPRNDVYGLGALLYYMATGAEPSQSPRPHDLCDRPPALVRPGLPNALEQAIARCLTTRSVRYATMQDVDKALAAVPSGSAAAPAYGSVTAGIPASRARDCARRAADALCAEAQPSGEAPGLAWVSRHPLSHGVIARDLNTGSGGTVLALAQIVEALGHDTHRAVLAASARALALAAEPGDDEALPGLYVGEAGVAVALLRAGTALADAGILDQAVARSNAVAAMPHGSPDLFHGTAGRLRCHLLVCEHTDAQTDVDRVVDCAEYLLGAALDDGDGGLCWPIPPGYGALSAQRYLGYAHGDAGIADALLDAFELTHDERCLEASRKVARRLRRTAVATLNDGSGLNWPSVEGQACAAAYWCHGAAGISRFWLHAATLQLVPDAGDVARRALRTVARGARWAGPTQCHGLAGAIDVLIDAYQVTGDAAHLAEARSLGRLLQAFGHEIDGNLVWASETPDIITPDFNVGYAGVAVAFLRIADPELPSLLARRYP
jgi:hypothetical protein